MAGEKGRYWVYVHDDEGDLVENIEPPATLDYNDGDFLDFADAIDAAANWMWGHLILAQTHTIRIVDKHKDSVTVWLAGPGNQIVPLEGSV